MRIVDGAFQQNYRGGTIRVMSGNAEATVRHRIIVRYTGMHCFGGQRGAGDDDMYALISVYAPEQGDVDHASVRIPSPDGVVEMNDGRSSAEGTRDLWSGPPQDLVMLASLWEHDNSAPDDVKTVVDGAFVSGITAAALPSTGPVAIPIGAISAWLIPKITSWVLENALGFGDDNIGNWVSPPFHFDDLMGATKPRTEWAGLEYNFETDLITDGDASYKLFFDVIHEEITEVLPAP